MTSVNDPPRGILHPQLPTGPFEHTRRAPSPPLALWVKHYWHVSWDLRGMPPQTQETLPHPNVQLVVERGHTGIYGVHTRRFTRILQGRAQAFGIKFAAGGFHPFLRTAVSRLGNRSLPIAEVFGNAAACFEDAVLSYAGIEEMTTLAENLLISQQPKDDAQVTTARQLNDLIASDRNILRVDQVCSLADLSKRSLQRLFQQYVGIGPKWVINRYRLHEALAQVQSGDCFVWSELALALGYFDQAHFIRDFRTLVGCAPDAYRRDHTLRR